MKSWFGSGRCGPIGVDLGSRSVKLLQFDEAQSRVVEAARWDLAPPGDRTPEDRDAELIEALRRVREGRQFRGHDAVFSIGSGDLFVQNIRVAPAAGKDLDKAVVAEAAGRLPFAAPEAEIRYLEAADVRQGDVVRREVILLACHRPVLKRIAAVAEGAGLRPVAIDPQPAALLRCYARQFRRDEDLGQRLMFVHVGASSTAVIIGEGTQSLFIKYLEIGGQHFDQAVARNLKMTLSDALALRRHNGDRRAEQRDPAVTRSIGESIRPVLDRLGSELSMCARYHSVTFRGQALARVVVGGGEAHESLVESLASRIDVPCLLGDPLRSYEKALSQGRLGQWDVAAGLALRSLN